MNQANTGDGLDAFLGKRTFNDPFLLPSSDSIPLDLESALDFCLYLYYMNPQYRRASIRVVSHFVTDIEFEGESGDKREKEDLRRLLVEDLNILGAMMIMGEEHACYGNSFMRVHFPFDRYLVYNDGKKDSFLSLDTFPAGSVRYLYKTMEYEVPDPKTLHLGEDAWDMVKLPFEDYASNDASRISLRTLDPRRITIMHSSLSGNNQYVYRFEEQFRKDIKDGHLWQVNDTPKPMLRALSGDNDFEFYPDEIFHLKAPSVSGITNRGFGVPEVLANYRSLHLLQIYRRIDEAVGMDYLLPFRIFTPETGTNITDSSLHMLFGSWKTEMADLIKRRRADPTHIQATPIPVNYQEFGAQGKQLTPKDLIEFQVNDMLDGMGYPAELFRGSLTVQQVPTALRLFENSFHFLSRGLDRFLKWTTRRVLAYLNQEQIGVSLKSPTMADDLEARHIYMQLAAGGEIPRSHAWAPFGIKDPVQAAQTRFQEDLDIQTIQEKMQADFERKQTIGSMDAVAGQQQQGGGPPQGPGGGGGAPPGGGSTPLDIVQEADQIAQQLLQIPEDGERSKQLAQIRAGNPNLHAMVKQKMEEYRSQAGSAGRSGVADMLGGG